jgi:hypothetical protein
VVFGVLCKTSVNRHFSLPEKRRPEWISREDILRYQAQMLTK